MVRYLLDTHTLLWFIAEDEQLSSSGQQLILDSSSEIFISTASLWEIAIKINIGKLALNKPFEQSFPDELDSHGIEILDITVDTLVQLTTLPLHHRDPFDRLIIARAIVEGIPIISKDEAFDLYDVKREW